MSESCFTNIEAFVAEYWSNVYKKRAFNAGEKDEIWKRGKGKCAYCLKKLTRKKAVFDHIYPWLKGGPTEVNNGAIACVSCNIRKGHNGDKHSPIDVTGLFLRRVEQEVQGPKHWGGYYRKNREVVRVLRGKKNGA